MNTEYIKMLFDEVDENMGVTTDYAPAISISDTTELVNGIRGLQKVLGVATMTPMAAGDEVKIYKHTLVKGGKQAGEGQVIPLSKVKRELDRTLQLKDDLYRTETTLQAIRKVGRAIAIDESDQVLLDEIRGDIIDNFYSTLEAGRGTAQAGSTFQAAAANCWGAAAVAFEDKEVTPIFFAHPLTIATYLGTAPITTQSEFGFNYIQNFLGLGNVVVSSRVPQNKVIGTAVQNIKGVYGSSNGDVARSFNLSYDASGLVGITHAQNLNNATVDTMIDCAVLFYVKDLDAVFTATIGE